MNEVVNTGAGAQKSPEELAGLKNVTMVVYLLQGLSFLWGVTAIVGIVVNYVKRDDVRGTVYESHFDWQIRTFWWGLAWTVLGFILLFAFGLGVVVWFVAGIWAIYRVVKGFLKLNDNQPVHPA
jgi:uncharacterized membrane protein